MNKLPDLPEHRLPTLAEQRSDFTAEGSPPAGKVLTSAPVRPRVQRKPGPPRRPVRAAAKSKQPAARAKP